MKFRELLKSVSFFSIGPRMLELYPDQEELIDNYGEVYETMILKDYEDSDMVLQITFIRDEWTSKSGTIEMFGKKYVQEEDETHVDEWWNVNGVDGTVYTDDTEKHGHIPEEWYGKTVTYALEFEPWSKWLGYTVCGESLKTLGEIDYIVHALWELTFLGFTEESVDEQREILDEAKKSLDDTLERQKNGEDVSDELIPLEDIFKRLDDDE